MKGENRMSNTLFAKDTFTELVNPSGMRAAIYCRLSKDDEKNGESESIQNQKAMLEQYCEQCGFEVVAVYQDDGYTGLDMNRPDVNRMLKAVERGQIDIVLTKDLSRLSRDYGQIGQLMDKFFPKHSVRYISLNDGIDSNDEISTTYMPFQAVMKDKHPYGMFISIQQICNIFLYLDAFHRLQRIVRLSQFSQLGCRANHGQYR